MIRKTVVYIAALTVALSLPVLITLTAVESIAFSEPFFLRQHKLLKIEQDTGFTASDYQRFSRALWDYYLGRASSPQVFIPTDHGPKQPLYKDYELAHLADVHHLFRSGVTVRNLAAMLFISGIVLIIFPQKKHRWRLIASAIAAGSTGAIFLFALLLLAVQTNFNQAFTYFHYLSFDNMLWQLDPATDNLIRLFPEQFFFNATVAIVMRATAALVLLAAISIVALYRKKS
ncbi:MAG: TIGR01906 family membrane protein [bacterium]